MDRIQLGKWQKVVFTRPLTRGLHRLAEGVYEKKLRVLYSQQEPLSKIYRSLGSDCDPMESVTVMIEDPTVLSIIQESLEGLIENVEDVQVPDFAF